MTRGSSTARAAGIVTLVVAGLLGSAYVLGRSLVPDQTPRQSTGVTASADGRALRRPARRWRAGRSPERQRKRGSGPAQPRPARTGPDGTPEATTLFGAHATTGTPTARADLRRRAGPALHAAGPRPAARIRRASATFCVVGENAQNHPDLVQAIVDDGHTLCNHSWHHDVGLGARSRRRDPGRPPAHQRGDPGGGAERPDRLVPPAGRRLDVPGGVGGAAARHDPAALVGGSVGLGATRRRQDHRDGARARPNRARWCCCTTPVATGRAPWTRCAGSCPT